MTRVVENMTWGHPRLTKSRGKSSFLSNRFLEAVCMVIYLCGVYM